MNEEKVREEVEQTIDENIESEKVDSSFSNATNEVRTVEQKPLVNLSSSKEEIVARIRETNNIDELRDLTNLFGLSLTKSEIVRASKESDLMDKLIELVSERIINKGECLPNADLLDYLKTLQGNVDKSRKTFNDDVDKASIKIQDNHTEINVTMNDNVAGLSRESREKVLERMKTILSQINQEQQDVVLEEPQEVEIVEEESNEDD